MAKNWATFVMTESDAFKQEEGFMSTACKLSSIVMLTTKKTKLKRSDNHCSLILFFLIKQFE